MKRKAVLLDRDGTLNPDPGYINDPADFALFPGTGAALRVLIDAGFTLALVTNQSGIARGLITPDQLTAIHRKLASLLEAEGVCLAGVFVCPHHPDYPQPGVPSPCGCRKPSPGLALRAITELKLDPKRTYVIGDRPSDVLMAEAAGLTAVAVSREPLENLPRSASQVPSLREAVQWILAEDHRRATL